MKHKVPHDQWFQEEIEPHEQCLRAWLKNRFGLTNVLDDVVQEAYLRIFKAHEKRPIGSPRAYLFQTARNVAIDFLKSARKNDHISIEEESNIVSLIHQDIARDIIEYRNEVELLKESLAALPERCRQIFVMRRLQGMSSSEIAQRLKISTHTVSSQLTIGLRKCSEFMENASRQRSSLSIKGETTIDEKQQTTP